MERILRFFHFLSR